MRGRRWAAVVRPCCACCSRGCGGSPEPKPAPKAEPSTSPSASATPPVMPAAAKAEDEGGRDRVCSPLRRRHQLRGALLATVDEHDASKAASASRCHRVFASIEPLRTVADHGGRRMDSRQFVSDVRHSRHGGTSTPGCSGHKWSVEAGASPQHFEGGERPLNFGLETTGGGWKVDDWTREPMRSAFFAALLCSRALGRQRRARRRRGRARLHRGVASRSRVRPTQQATVSRSATRLSDATSATNGATPVDRG